MALSADRNTPRKEGDLRRFPVAAATKIFAGALVCLDAAGNATPGAVATTLTAVGRAEAQADNTGGSAGDVAVDVRKGTFRYANSAAADEISREDIGSTAYVVDDETVALTNGTSTRSAAGTIYDVDAQGVWITH
ncbi:hypothetical protein A3718_12120 [Erythrobacter sp. HI0019]|uniref:hypothetical protein n=1 Tax=unclassified Erythrobacter TaxID=2633097 RepID=UPI0007B8B5AF|nr:MULTISPECIES: hypothetical protein [unclassified Erythrobacter]KZX92309.1 hypothetical protein A3718_12120 [Erythrobacter sp. HI0019]KZY08079.1 hypothetical protein A3723_13855 [Erythrobacter sp. HI0028]